jgi:hypothetical protein
VAALETRIDALQVRMAATEQKQSAYLAQVAVAELEQQKDRMATYQVQARFALATMYDRAANPPPEKKDAAPAQQGPADQGPGEQGPAGEGPIQQSGPGTQQSLPQQPGPGAQQPQPGAAPPPGPQAAEPSSPPNEPKP